MFGELGKKLAGLFGSLAQQPESRPALGLPQEAGEASHPKSCKPWEDRTLPATERYQSYYDVARAKCEAIRDAGNRPGITAKERYQISQDPEANHWVDELRQLKGETAEQFCRRIDGGPQRELLGKNYLGAEAWAAQGIDVGAVPPLPASITEALLNSDCPLHPGEKIKDTHLLVLIPKTVNGEPYTALKLDELCATRKGSGDKLIYDGDDWLTKWKKQDWANLPQAQSEWVLIPKSDPDPERMREKYGEEQGGNRHFRSKDIAAQEKVHGEHYKEYREVKALEVMTMALLYDLTHKERLLPALLRCEEPNAFGGRVCVGRFNALGLLVDDDRDGHDRDFIGRALARK